jgi:hypothetical protein
MPRAKRHAHNGNNRGGGFSRPAPASPRRQVTTSPMTAAPAVPPHVEPSRLHVYMHTTSVHVPLPTSMPVAGTIFVGRIRVADAPQVLPSPPSSPGAVASSSAAPAPIVAAEGRHARGEVPVEVVAKAQHAVAVIAPGE